MSCQCIFLRFLGDGIMNKNLLKNFSKKGLIIGLLLSAGASIVAQPRLSQFGHKGASVLPQWDDKGMIYVMLAREATGPDAGTWDDFGGKKANETHPVDTAARRFALEAISSKTMGWSESQVRKFIDVDSNNTYRVVAQAEAGTERTNFVTYVTKFKISDMDSLWNNFDLAQAQAQEWKYKTKDALAKVNIFAIANAIREASGDNNVWVPATTREGSKVIRLRPFFVAKLRNFFLFKPPTQEGRNPVIHFYSPTPVSPMPPMPMPTPIQPTPARSIPLVAPPRVIPPARPVVPADQIVRKNFFEDIVGIKEDQFRKKYKWAWNNPTRITNKRQWIQQHSRRAAIFQGNFNFYTVDELNRLVAQNRQPLTTTPRFTILIHDPSNPKETDIRYLQSNPANKNAVFQLASTFWGPLEGGIYKEKAFLSGMLHSPVQGEEASISAAGATIYRKYFMPQYYYLLHELKNKIPMIWMGGEPTINLNVIRNYRYNPNDKTKVGIGLHSNIVVSSGYGEGRSENDKQERLNIVVDQQGNVDTMRSQIISQVFTSAYNTIGVRRKQQLNQNIIDMAQMLLNASYEGTLKAAFAIRKPKVFLTLMGAGAFRNDIGWLEKALNRREIIDFIQTKGMDVTLIFRPDKKRDNPVREPRGDFQFLKSMLEIADEINRTNLRNNPAVLKLIDEYLTSAYEYENTKNPNAYRRYTSSAAKLKGML